MCVTENSVSCENSEPVSQCLQSIRQPEYCDRELKTVLEKYVLSSNLMRELGYPVEVAEDPSSAEFYLHFTPHPKQYVYRNSRKLNLNAAKLIAKVQVCVRCGINFNIGPDGEYVTLQKCKYHRGRLVNNTTYECCDNVVESLGCTTGRLHVWTSNKAGLNGPVKGYVKANAKRGGIFALDAEMAYTTKGLELVGVVIVNPTGSVVYSTLVCPEGEIIDANTRFSDIKSNIYVTKKLRDVQDDLLQLIGTDTILVGHAVENDLRALQLIHTLVVDTSALYQHTKGLPYRRALRSLAYEVLSKSIQNGAHDATEDATTAMELVFARLNKDGHFNACKQPCLHTKKLVSLDLLLGNY